MLITDPTTIGHVAALLKPEIGRIAKTPNHSAASRRQAARQHLGPPNEYNEMTTSCESRPEEL
ncbi:hypothetical protein FOY51_26990 [Antrihabitans cavernicola]|uniref:Uncharacterized protein n=1 Tax=Antrihabitans cavernicola TaxID=2495913 RepID=A0A5A7S2A6_9NOCA|nr:hypothetical protein FOY51_26990 [Spelaeibacter cavernicola]